jgi:hypothetical protein
MIAAEIEIVKSELRNEIAWEEGYSGDTPNPHTQNIATLKKYLELLQSSKK